MVSASVPGLVLAGGVEGRRAREEELMRAMRLRCHVIPHVTSRNQRQKTTLRAQIALNRWFLVFQFGLFPTRSHVGVAPLINISVASVNGSISAAINGSSANLYWTEPNLKKHETDLLTQSGVSSSGFRASHW
eukprot:915628-Rhodomonas_salina.1